MKKILLTGGNGMLSSDFKKIPSSNYEIISCTREDLDITSFQDIQNKINLYSPELIINCAAYTAVDNAQDIGKKENFEINTLGVGYLAQVCNERNIDFITFSTDYVFDGSNLDGYSETDIQNPINMYGLAKYCGEKLAQNIYSKSIIIRTSWLYGGGKNYKNFVNTMLKLSETRSELTIVNDQFGIPTYTGDLCKALIMIIEQIESKRGKIFHFSNSSYEGRISWADFAQEIFKQSKRNIKIIRCNSNQYPTKAQRPQYSLLINNSHIQLPDWKEGLKKYLNTLGN